MMQYDIVKIVNAALKFLERRFTLLGDKVVKALNTSTAAYKEGTDKQVSSFQAIGVRLEKSLGSLKNLKADVDLSVLEKQLSGISKDMAKLAAKDNVDMTDVESTLRLIYSAVRENEPERLGEKFDALDVVFKGLKPKDSVKFDDTQIKGLMGALTNITTQGGPKSATDWQVDTVTVTSADTEYEYAFPSNTVSWTLKLRGGTGVLYYSHETGKLPVSGDNTNYLTLPASGTRSQDNVEWGGKKMFLESDSATQVLEIEVFTM